MKGCIMAKTIEDVMNSAQALGDSIHAFADADEKAHADEATAADAANVAAASELASATAKQDMLDAHDAFDEVLQEYLGSQGKGNAAANAKK